MIEILIGDDNKVSLKTTNGIAETEIAATIVVEAMRSLKKPEPDVKSKLVLVGYDHKRKLEAVKEVKEKLGLGLKEAKDIVDECVGRTVVVLSTGLKSKMDMLFNRFDPSVVQVKVIDDKEWV
jgi:ribosomal protein L7/L12